MRVKYYIYQLTRFFFSVDNKDWLKNVFQKLRKPQQGSLWVWLT
jgi:hypothetical protein